MKTGGYYPRKKIPRPDRAFFRSANCRKLLTIISAVSVAQLVEHRSVEPRVVGSNPIAHPKVTCTEEQKSYRFGATRKAQRLRRLRLREP